MDVPWKSDEEAAVEWILNRDPEFFGKHIPFIGYAEFLYEGEFRGSQRIQSLKVEISYVLGGLHSPPRDEAAYKNRYVPWRYGDNSPPKSEPIASPSAVPPSSSRDVEPSASIESTRQWRYELALIGSSDTNESVAVLLHKVEQSSFEEAYRLWLQEKEALAKNGASNGFYTIPAGVTDPKTGKFTPSRIAALQCRLGQEAHLHEAFLLKELAADADVHRVLESSQRLCEKYGIYSMARVQFIPGQGYTSKDNNGYSPQAQQALWLKATTTAGSPPDGAAHGNQPMRSETNVTSPAAGPGH
jgi:hypothetical protein